LLLSTVLRTLRRAPGVPSLPSPLIFTASPAAEYIQLAQPAYLLYLHDSVICFQQCCIGESPQAKNPFRYSVTTAAHTSKRERTNDDCYPFSESSAETFQDSLIVTTIHNLGALQLEDWTGSAGKKR